MTRAMRETRNHMSKTTTVEDLEKVIEELSSQKEKMHSLHGGTIYVHTRTHI